MSRRSDGSRDYCEIIMAQAWWSHIISSASLLRKSDEIMRKKLCRYEFSPSSSERSRRFQSLGGRNDELIDMWQPRYSLVPTCLFTRHFKSHFSRLDLPICDSKDLFLVIYQPEKVPFWHRHTEKCFPRFGNFHPVPVDIQSTRKCLLISPVRFQSTLKISNMLSHLFSLTQKRDKLGCLPSVGCHSPFARKSTKQIQ